MRMRNEIEATRTSSNNEASSEEHSKRTRENGRDLFDRIAGTRDRLVDVSMQLNACKPREKQSAGAQKRQPLSRKSVERLLNTTMPTLMPAIKGVGESSLRFQNSWKQPYSPKFCTSTKLEPKKQLEVKIRPSRVICTIPAIPPLPHSNDSVPAKTAYLLTPRPLPSIARRYPTFDRPAFELTPHYCTAKKTKFTLSMP
jgi:hypothetical protein